MRDILYEKKYADLEVTNGTGIALRALMVDIGVEERPIMCSKYTPPPGVEGGDTWSAYIEGVEFIVPAKSVFGSAAYTVIGYGNIEAEAQKDLLQNLLHPGQQQTPPFRGEFYRLEQAHLAIGPINMGHSYEKITKRFQVMHNSIDGCGLG